MSDSQKKSELAQKEEEVLEFWKENNIFEKTLEKVSPKGEFVFYEGPPTANGRPGIHHLESRAFKDAIPRYKTMQGYHVRRKGGWDTHGLPVELEVEKELGLKSKKEIEEFGIEKFNEKCKESVWKYVSEWEDFTRRIGYWLDLENAYVTYRPEYMESLWWILGQVNEQGLLYKDYKVLPWCPRCGTALSSHELAQGYADVKDLSVTAKFELEDEPGTYVLAWTTTPWTLPGNVGLAVGEDIVYGIYRVKKGNLEEKVIVAQERADAVFAGLDYELLEEIQGKTLVGKNYKPLYPFLQELIQGEEKEKLKNAYKMYAADFVTTEDGTGIVHTAVMYGQDDFELGSLVGLPKFHLVNEEGHFIEGTDFLKGRFVKDEEVAVDIIKDLAHQGLLFSKEKYEHSYPHCWRCKTPLIYYARDSWYINMQSLKEKLISENQEINWEPDHIKNGRFGEWLENLRDWAISRERYWGTPLPVWESEDGDRIVVDSIETLKKYTKKSGNTYTLIRHGQAQSNIKHQIACLIDSKDSLTKEGERQVKELTERLIDKKIDLIVTSPIQRTRETAEIISKATGGTEVLLDERLLELQVGKEYEGRSWSEYWDEYPLEDQMNNAGKGETRIELKRRVGELLFELETKYSNKTILLIGHNSSLSMLLAVASFSGFEQTKDFVKSPVFEENAVVHELDFAPLPHNQDYELDLHRPYIDEVILEKEGKEYRRVKEVMDVWFDSGAMPFAQDHYPFENKEWVDGQGFPADYISEAIDQTRGWFYTLHAVGNLLGKGRAYKNVICLGHILDAEGQKMSKSKGNTVNPWEAMDKYGVDVLRFWMYSVNQPGEAKNFDERTVDEVNKKVFNLLFNVLNFYEMYRPKDDESRITNHESPNVLDQWILAKLNELVRESTEHLDSYRLLEPTRGIRDFIGDFSQWYIRRSRDRFKAGGGEDSDYALETTRFVLMTLSQLLAPFAPFVAEDVFRRLRREGDEESVHLTRWPEAQDLDESPVVLMEKVRDYVSWALEARDAAGIKIRQPLSTLKIKGTSVPAGYTELIKDEVNVKEVFFVEELDHKDWLAWIDVSITPELEREGWMREIVRHIQGMRKKANLSPDDEIKITVSAPEEIQNLVTSYQDEITATTNVKEIVFADTEGDSLLLGEHEITISIQ